MKKILFLIITLQLLSCDFGKNVTDKATDLASIKGVDVVGHGYDVFDRYADPEDVKLAALDINALLADDLVYVQNIEKSEFSTITGKNFDEYVNSFSLKTNLDGDYTFYSGSVKVNYNENQYKSVSQEFATICSDIKKYAVKLKIKNNPDAIREYLVPELKALLQNPEENSDKIFQEYGTHILTGIIMGARLDYNFTAKSIKESSQVSIESYAKASYKSVFASANIEAESINDEKWEKHYQGKSWNTIVIGGSSEFGQQIHNDGKYTDWIETIADNPAFSNIESDGLMPIWKIVEDESKRNILKEKYLQWCEKYQYKVAPVVPSYTCLVDIKVEFSDRGTTFDAGNLKYCRIDQDMNEDGGGADVYIYAAYGKSDRITWPTPITDIVSISDKDNPSEAYVDCPSNYTIIKKDLNESAGGHYVYLCVQRNKDLNPVTNIYVNNRTDNENSYPYQHKFTSLPYDSIKRMLAGVKQSYSQDLSIENGGDDMYLYQSFAKFD